MAALAMLTLGAVLFASGFWAGSARGMNERAPAIRAAPLPDWFLPVWDLYDRNPAVTPTFDFAALYSTETPAAPERRRR